MYNGFHSKKYESPLLFYTWGIQNNGPYDPNPFFF